MGMEDFRFLLNDLAVAFREDALWADTVVPGRFRIDPFELGLAPVEPGLGVTQVWFYCDRAVVPKPWPQLGDHLTIRGQVYEIVQHDEDDIGEFGFRLIKEELGISTVTSEGAYSVSDRRFGQPHYGHDKRRHPGRPSRRDEIVQVFETAVASGELDPTLPVHELLTAMRARLGNGQGLSDKTLRRILTLVRAR
jgi:hypothetical protein